MALFYEKRNLDNIAKLADHTRAAALQWYAFLVANNINILIYETIRTEEKQREYVRQGASKTMRSYHIVGQALDFVPVDAAGNTIWNGYGAPEVQMAIAEAKQLGFEWGGDWTSFVDQPHLQFNYRGYKTDTFRQQPNEEVPKPSAVPTGNSIIAGIQETLNSRYNTAIKADGYYGPKTEEALLKGLQTELNKQFNKRLVVDGKWGSKTAAACVTVRKGAKGNIAWIVEALLYCHGYNAGTLNGDFDTNSANALLSFQHDHGLVQDAIAGRNTFEKFFA
jgi:peptidoglycan LD-endopeptidase CwlK